MNLDHSVYPDLAEPPLELHTMADRADYMHRICGAFDFGVFPERDDWKLFAGWKDVFDWIPLRDSPAYHTFRSRFGWEPVTHGSHGLPFHWKMADEREGRIDPCEDWV